MDATKKNICFAVATLIILLGGILPVRAADPCYAQFLFIFGSGTDVEQIYNGIISKDKVVQKFNCQKIEFKASSFVGVLSVDGDNVTLNVWCEKPQKALLRAMNELMLQFSDATDSVHQPYKISDPVALTTMLTGCTGCFRVLCPTNGGYVCRKTKQQACVPNC